MESLPPDEHPGTYVRRYLGHAASDEELLLAFLEKVKHLAPEKRAVTWVYAVCLAMPDGHELKDEPEIPAVFIDQPVLPILPGYPLSSILFNTEIGKVHREMSLEEER
jgi:inosine/xanthosine triphosphate pyrophosphatase family protein